MQWWNEFVAWLGSPAGVRVLTSAVIPFVAIIVAAFIAVWIGRSFARRLIDQQDGELKAAAIMALIGSGRKAAIWNTLGVDEKQHIDSLISEADIRVRLLPVNGASAAADWASHELASMKKNSTSFSFQAEQTFFDYRDRLLEWQNKPKRARKLFAYDLERWRYDDDAAAESTARGTSESTARNPAASTAQSTAAATLPTPATPATNSYAPVSVNSPDQPETPALVVGDTAAIGVPDEKSTEAAPSDVSAVPAAHDEADFDGDDEIATENPYSPVNAGTVRQRIAPEHDSQAE